MKKNLIFSISILSKVSDKKKSPCFNINNPRLAQLITFEKYISSFLASILLGIVATSELYSSVSFKYFWCSSLFFNS